MTDAGALVVDASALVDLLARTELADAVAARLRDGLLHAPAHVDVEVLSALGLLQRAGEMTANQVRAALVSLSSAPITRLELPPLLAGAWRRRNDLRLTDALYVELASGLGLPLVTTDGRLARAWRGAELVGPT